MTLVVTHSISRLHNVITAFNMKGQATIDSYIHVVKDNLMLIYSLLKFTCLSIIVS